MIRSIHRIVLLATALLVVQAASATPVAAQGWTDRTTMTFTEAVKVPGATLQPGTYIFELVSPERNAAAVKITSQDGKKSFGVFNSVPTRRPQATEDVVLLFSATDKGTMPAIRGWFPAGGRHGHLFLYSKDEAQSLAQRTRELVLSQNVSGSKMESGTIVVLNPTGTTEAWRLDPDTQREWDSWRQSRARESTAPMVADTPRGEKVKIADLENHPERYVGKTINVDGEVDNVLGPHLFELDQPGEGQKEGDVFVLVPKNLLALVRNNDKVTVTGTVLMFDRTKLHREAAWLNLDDDVRPELAKRPMLIATRIAGESNDRAFVLDTTAETPAVVRSAVTVAPITDVTVLGVGDQALVGRFVNLSKQKIESLDDKDGFYVRAGDHLMFVLMQEPDGRDIKVGDTVDLSGVVLQLPRDLVLRLKAPDGINQTIYVYAQTVKK